MVRGENRQPKLLRGTTGETEDKGIGEYADKKTEQ